MPDPKRTELVLSESAVQRLQALANELFAKLAEQGKAIVTADLSEAVGRMQRGQGEAETARDAARTEKADLDRQILELRGAIERVQGEARAAEDRRDALRLEVDALEPRVRTLRAEIDEKKQRVAAL
jgi:peptidoglycan hydrolase CwlO-like protein